MPEGRGKAPRQMADPGPQTKDPRLRALFQKPRKRRILETLAAFVGGGWLLLEFVHWILVDHYRFPEKSIDIAFITVLGALLGTLAWRWLSGRERPRKFRPEKVLLPLIILITILLDINLLLHLEGPEWESIPITKWQKSIAVLPFVDMSPERNQEYFCDGMTEDLITRLNNIKELKVAARTSAFMFKGTAPSIGDVGEKLKVKTVLEGSIQKSGDRIRVSAQLINVVDGYSLWSGRYERDLKDVFAIQDEISSAIVEALRLELTAQEKLRIAEHSIANIAVYDLYLGAKADIFRFDKSAADRALMNLQHGLSIIGDNATLDAALALVYWQYFNIGAMQEDGIRKAEEYAQKALDLDPQSALSHACLAVLSTYKEYPENLRSILRHGRRALASNPSQPEALSAFAWTYSIIGKLSRAQPFMDRLNQIDPLNPLTSYWQGINHFYAGRFDLAAGQFYKQREADPQNPVALFSQSLALVYNNETERALDLLDQFVQTDPRNAVIDLGLLLKCSLRKDRDGALKIMTPDFYDTCRRDFEWSHYVAAILSLLDAKKESLDWLENAISRGFINYPFLSEKDTLLDNVRRESRFQRLMERARYEWEHFKE